LKTALPLIFLFAALAGCREAPVEHAKYTPREGDVVFQSFPPNPLTEAIEGVTQSEFSHCGIVRLSGGKWVVLEAVGPVKETPLGEWTARGRGGHYAVYRFKDKYQPRVPAIVAASTAYLGRPYDIHYRFGDRAVYCSELVFEGFKSATGESLGQVQRLGELNWEPHAAFIKQIENGDVPLDRKMITPAALSRAPQLALIFSNYPPRN